MSLNSHWFKNGQPSSRQSWKNDKNVFFDRDSTFSFHHTHLKKAILLHKMARVPSDLNTAVYVQISYFYVSCVM